MSRRLVAVVGTLALVAVTEFLAVLIAPSFRAVGLTLASGPGSAGGASAGGVGLWGLLPVVLGIALGTLLVLAIGRFGLDPRVVRVVLMGSLATAVALVLYAVLSLPLGAGLAVAVLVAGAVWIYPEWYVVDTVAVVAVAGVTALLGASLALLPVLVALVGMAVYDAYSVYRSGHMAALADTSAQLGMPTMFVVPTERGTSTRDLDGIDTGDAGSGSGADGDAGTVAVLGAGDALFPGLLVVAATGVGTPVVGPFTLPALGAFAGSLLGLLALQFYVHRNPGVHAGLPALNAATILGYLVGAVATGVSVVTAVGL